ncbi:MerR family transcriptional regulator [Pseudooceanicola marinus]|uniref:MerR family transcriptional regulator n=1 Tax=Pseudooceanicola marinus TaxID=396013 RepID=UPI001CD59359|nr:MerR family transcriptional regulator [Pseudooceanicola marinus]MCA1334188.1 MerR family transcriptional regulator [Pseudooceanicola marinus]
MPKSADAFRTISEVAEWLGTPAHVLRFWESKFTQVRPVKRAGGRRYYRPSDMELLGGIKRLLHEEGMTIKGVQKLLRDRGIAHVAAMSPPLDDLAVPLEAEVVQLKPRSAPPEAGPDAMMPPDGSESGPAAAADAVAPPAEDAPADPLPGHATMTTDVAAEAPRAPDLTETPVVAAESDNQDEGDSEDRNLFSDLDAQEAPEVEETTAATVAAAAEPPVAPAPVTVPDDPEDDAFAPESGVLSCLLSRRSPLPPATAARALALAQDLVALR